MKLQPAIRLSIVLLLVAAFALQGCSLASPLPNNTEKTGSNPSTPTKAAAHPNQTAILPNAAAGLAELKAYQSVLQIEATGNLDGQPFKRSTRVQITRAGSGDFDSQIQTTDGRAALRLLALGSAYYRWSGSDPACQGSMNPPGEEEVIEPAALLPPLGAADRVGVETVNQVSSVHYRFDQSALPNFKSAGDISGEVWLAENGGYVLRYYLTAAAPRNPTSKGLEVSQTYSYELTPDSPAPALPTGCAPVPVDLPVLEGAQSVNRAGGLVTFVTPAAPRAVIDFYQQKLAALGWKAETASPTGEVVLPVYYDFTQGGLRLTVNLTSGEDQATAVTLLVVDAAAQAAEAPHPTQPPSKPGTPLPTIDPAQSGLPPNVPLYPGATSLMQAGGAVMFQSTDPWEDVAVYYRKQLEMLGWAAASEQSLGNGVSMVWNQGGTMLILNIMVQDDQTQIIVSLPK